MPASGVFRHAIGWAGPGPNTSALALGQLHVAIGLLCLGHAARYCVPVIALLFAAVAVGLSNLAASIGIGVMGVTARTRLQVGLVFGVFEAGMPIVGLLIGHRAASDLGQAVRWPGAILLMIVGSSGLVRSLRESRGMAADEPGEFPHPHPPHPVAGRAPGLARLLVSGFVLSMDNLVVGFALGTYQVGIVAGAVLIGAVSVVMSLAGLELGGLLGRWASERSEQMSGVILILVGAAIAGGALG
jgi:manganese efflux pump family protein